MSLLLAHRKKLLVLLLLIAIWAYLRPSLSTYKQSLDDGIHLPSLTRHKARTEHPIEILAKDAEKEYASLVKRQSGTLAEASAEYKRRYNREPPPGFGVWFNKAKEANSSIIDDYDTITARLEPYFGISPKDLRARVAMVLGTTSIEGYTIDEHHNLIYVNSTGWNEAKFRGLLEPYLQYLPAMDFAINGLDEPRVVVPRDRLEEHYETTCPTAINDTQQQRQSFDWIELKHQAIWPFATLSCREDSPSRSIAFEPPKHRPFDFLKNVTSNKDICNFPEAAASHGFFASPISFQVTTHLIPILSQSGLSICQDLLFPPNYEGDADEDSDPPWEEKTNTLYWAGGNTGGYAQKKGDWHHMHRQRFVSLVNDASRPIQLLSNEASGKWESYEDTMASLADKINVKFGGAPSYCDDAGCKAMGSDLPFGESDDKSAAYQSRLLFDVDGNVSTFRFYRLLNSRSTLLKQTIFQEWHDERLVPWYHYVPVSLGMEELPELLRYLMEDERGQEIAREIAEKGRQGKQELLRDADMGLALFRVMLEYARLIDDERDQANGKCPAR